jgi:hypothetical protein
MQPQPPIASQLQANASTALSPSNGFGAGARLAPMTSVINDILKTEPGGSLPVDSISISRQITTAMENAEMCSPGSGAALHVSGDGSPATFIMRMPPSDQQLQVMAARHQQSHKQDVQRSPNNDSSFAFDDVPSISDFDIPSIAASPALHAKSVSAFHLARAPRPHLVALQGCRCAAQTAGASGGVYASKGALRF